MNLFRVFNNVKHSFGNNFLPVKLVPPERNRNFGQCIKGKRHPLTILLLAVAIVSAMLNVFFLMNYSINTERDKRNFDYPNHQDDETNQGGRDKRGQPVRFVAKVTETPPNKDFKRIQLLAQEIPAAGIDGNALRDIHAVYKPAKYEPKYYKNQYRNSNQKDIKEEMKEDKNENVDNGGKDLKAEEDKSKRIQVVIGDDEDEPRKIKFWTQRRAVPPDLYQFAPEVFDNVHKKFEAGLKNPCWRLSSQYNWKLQCLPYFFIIGMPKCGTSDLWYKIVQHPQVMLLVKEPHWWTRARIGVRRPKLPFSDYLNLPESLYSEIQKGRNDVIYGDGSASTMWDNRGWQQFFPSNVTEPPFVVADIIREILPDAKLIIILRDPVERLYSDYLYMRDVKNPSAIDFHHRVLKSIKSYEECRERRSLRYCSYEDNPMDGEVRLRIGFYSLYLREWVRLYPVDQLVLVELKQWSEYCTDILPQIYNFLELDALEENEIQEICKTRTINQNPRKKQSAGDMLPETREILQNLYRPFNDDLNKLMGVDFFDW